MTKWIGYFSAICLLTFFISSCTCPNKCARQAGQPVGGGLSVIQSVPEGVAEGYAGGDRDENPYGR